jgi:hypothetical protein
MAEPATRERAIAATQRSYEQAEQAKAEFTRRYEAVRGLNTQ